MLRSYFHMDNTNAIQLFACVTTLLKTCVLICEMFICLIISYKMPLTYVVVAVDVVVVVVVVVCGVAFISLLLLLLVVLVVMFPHSQSFTYCVTHQRTYVVTIIHIII